jgi:nitroreductase
MKIPVGRRDLLIAGGAALVGAGVGAYVEVGHMGSMARYGAAASALRAPLSDPTQMGALVRYATLAASGHNTQLWRFRLGERTITILPDPSRRTPIVDSDDHHLFVSLGCAAENLSLAAAARGLFGQPIFNERDGGSIAFRLNPGKPDASTLFDAIPHRQSTRAEYDGRAVSGTALAALVKAAAVPGVDLLLITDRPNLDRVRDLVLAGNSAQMANPDFRRELKAWLRYNPHQATETGDGLFSAASGSPVLPSWAGPLCFDALVSAKSENDSYARQMRSSAGVAVFVSETADPDHWVRVGRACQRFTLQATALGLKCAFINQPVEVASLRPELASLAGVSGRRPDLIVRFGYGSALPYSIRRRPSLSVIA